MIKVNYGACCNECKYRDTYLKENKYYTYYVVKDVETEIGCKHEKVCMKLKDERK